MKILHTVESYYPEVGGMAEAVKQISEELVCLGHKVTVATGIVSGQRKKIINGVKIIEFDNPPKYQNYLLNSSFDIITNFAAQQWATDLILPILLKIRAKKVFVPTGFSGLYSPIYRNYYKKMKTWMGQYDMNIFLSNSYRDIDFARKNHIKNIKVIPNGASQKEFSRKSKIDIRSKLNIPINHFLVLNVSSHTGLKGHSDAIRIFNKASIANSILLIIGKHSKIFSGCYPQCQLLKSISRKNILIKDLTRKQTVAAFKAADIFLFTSRVECSPIVLFESIAAKTPFLTTDVGNAKEIIGWTKGGKILPTRIDKFGYSHALINKSASILKNYYDNRKRLSLMAKTGYRAWLKYFTWEKIAKQYEKIYLSLLKS